jgi:segregation and condensation protein A
MEYRVSLDIFDGPLDLLLHLIRRRELDVCDLALAEITDSYLRHVDALRDLADGGGVDLEEIGEFLVIAATLIEAKSRRLLPDSTPTPHEPAGDREADPRADLVRQLMEYRAFKEASEKLVAMRDEHAARFPRVPALREAGDEPPPLELEELHAWDLLAIYERLMGEVGRRGPTRHEVIDDDVPLELLAADVADRVRRERSVSLRDLLAGRTSRGECIGVFLALLELARERLVHLSANDAGTDVTLTPGDYEQGDDDDPPGDDSEADVDEPLAPAGA